MSIPISVTAPQLKAIITALQFVTNYYGPQQPYQEVLEELSRVFKQATCIHSTGNFYQNPGEPFTRCGECDKEMEGTRVMWGV